MLGGVLKLEGFDVVIRFILLVCSLGGVFIFFWVLVGRVLFYGVEFVGELLLLRSLWLVDVIKFGSCLLLMLNRSRWGKSKKVL